MFTTVAWSAPSLPAANEISLPSLVSQIEIPPSLGTIEKRYEPDSRSRVIVHIQDAHTSYEAQVRTKEILRHLTENYSFDLILLEGGFGKSEPGRLEFFKEPDINLKLADTLAQEGIVAGSELFLLEERFRPGPKMVQGYGIEDTNLYRANLKAFQKVYAEKDETGQFLSQLKIKIFTEASKIFNPKLHTFFRRWAFHEETEGDLLSHLRILQRSSKEALRLDLEDVRNQFEWPELVRILKIREMEQDLDPEKIEEERTALLRWLQENRVERTFVDTLRRWKPGEIPDFLPRRFDSSPRRFFEELYQTASPKGFSFNAYPHFSLWAGAEILRSEIEIQKLLDETNHLTEKIFEALIQTDKEKELIEAYGNYLLLRKLFSLELTYEEYQEIKKQGTGKPTNCDRFARPLFLHALRFYVLALRREEALHRNLLKRMRETKNSNVILITGGFHSQGLFNRFKKENFSYLRITPHISKIEDGESYRNLLAASQLRQFLMTTLTPSEMIGINPRVARQYARIVHERLNRIQQEGDGAGPVSGLRSELRAEKKDKLISEALLPISSRAEVRSEFLKGKFFDPDVIQDQRSKSAGKITLVWDLDETLAVYSPEKRAHILVSGMKKVFEDLKAELGEKSRFVLWTLAPQEAARKFLEANPEISPYFDLVIADENNKLDLEEEEEEEAFSKAYGEDKLEEAVDFFRSNYGSVKDVGLLFGNEALLIDDDPAIGKRARQSPSGGFKTYPFRYGKEDMAQLAEVLLGILQVPRRSKALSSEAEKRWAKFHSRRFGLELRQVIFGNEEELGHSVAGKWESPARMGTSSLDRHIKEMMGRSKLPNAPNSVYRGLRVPSEGGVEAVLREGFSVSEARGPWPIHFSRSSDPLPSIRAALTLQDHKSAESFLILLIRVDQHQIPGWVEDEDGGFTSDSVPAKAIQEVFVYHKGDRAFVPLLLERDAPDLSFRAEVRREEKVGDRRWKEEGARKERDKEAMTNAGSIGESKGLAVRNEVRGEGLRSWSDSLSRLNPPFLLPPSPFRLSSRRPASGPTLRAYRPEGPEAGRQARGEVRAKRAIDAAEEIEIRWRERIRGFLEEVGRDVEGRITKEEIRLKIKVSEEARIESFLQELKKRTLDPRDLSRTGGQVLKVDEAFKFQDPTPKPIQQAENRLRELSHRSEIRSGAEPVRLAPYSSLRNDEKESKAMKELIAEYWVEFGETLPLREAEQEKFLRSFMEQWIGQKKASPVNGSYEDALILYENDHPIGLFAYKANREKRTADDDGLFILETFRRQRVRGQSLARILVDATVTHLREEGIGIFNIGTDFWSHRIRGHQQAQRLFRRIEADNPQAVLKSFRDSGSRLRILQLDLEKYFVLPIGNIIPAVTPLRKKSGHQWEADYLDALYYFKYLKQEMGAEAVLVAGATGESHLMERGLREEMIKKLTGTAWVAQLTVFTNVTGNSVEEVVQNATVAKEAGAHALVVAPSAYLDDEEEIVKHLALLKKKFKLPIVLYNNPWIYRRNLSASLVKRLYDLRLVSAIKDSSGDLNLLKGFVATGIPVYQGNEGEIKEAIEAGARGVVGSSGSVSKILQRIAVTRDPEERHRLQEKIRSFRETLTVGTRKIPAGLKTLLSRTTFKRLLLMGSQVVRPSDRLTRSERDAIFRIKPTFNEAARSELRAGNSDSEQAGPEQEPPAGTAGLFAAPVAEGEGGALVLEAVASAVHAARGEFLQEWKAADSQYNEYKRWRVWKNVAFAATFTLYLLGYFYGLQHSVTQWLTPPLVMMTLVSLVLTQKVISLGNHFVLNEAAALTKLNHWRRIVAKRYYEWFLKEALPLEPNPEILRRLPSLEELSYKTPSISEVLFVTLGVLKAFDSDETDDQKEKMANLLDLAEEFQKTFLSEEAIAFDVQELVSTVLGSLESFLFISGQWVRFLKRGPPRVTDLESLVSMEMSRLSSVIALSLRPSSPPPEAPDSSENEPRRAEVRGEQTEEERALRREIIKHLHMVFSLIGERYGETDASFSSSGDPSLDKAYELLGLDRSRLKALDPKAALRVIGRTFMKLASETAPDILEASSQLDRNDEPAWREANRDFAAVIGALDAVRGDIRGEQLGEEQLGAEQHRPKRGRPNVMPLPFDEKTVKQEMQLIASMMAKLGEMVRSRREGQGEGTVSPERDKLEFGESSRAEVRQGNGELDGEIREQIRGMKEELYKSWLEVEMPAEEEMVNVAKVFAKGDLKTLGRRIESLRKRRRIETFVLLPLTPPQLLRRLKENLKVDYRFWSSEEELLSEVLQDLFVDLKSLEKQRKGTVKILPLVFAHLLDYNLTRRRGIGFHVILTPVDGRRTLDEERDWRADFFREAELAHRTGQRSLAVWLSQRPWLIRNRELQRNLGALEISFAIFERNLSDQNRELKLIAKRVAAGTGGSAIVGVPAADGPYEIVKLDRGERAKKLLRQVQWILKLPPSLRRLFPPILDAREDDSGRFILVMANVPAPSVADLLWEGKISPREALRYWVKARREFEKFQRKFQQEVPAGWARDNHYGKVKRRLKELETEQGEIFGDLLKKRRIQVDRESYLNLPAILRRIKKLMDQDTPGLLEPLELSLVHGDLYLGNILADNGKPKLIDPRGDPVFDPLYEFVKLGNTQDHAYLTRGRLSHQLVSNTEGFRLVFSGGAHPADPAYLAFSREMEKGVKNGRERLRELYGPHWKLRFWYEFSMLIAGNPIFHVKKSKEIARTYYLVGTIYLNRFARLYANELRRHGVPVSDELLKGLPEGSFSLRKPIAEQFISHQKIRAQSLRAEVRGKVKESLGLGQEREVSFSGNTRSPKIVQDNEYGHRTVTGDNNWAAYFWLCVDTVVAILTNKFKPRKFKDSGESLVGDRGDSQGNNGSERKFGMFGSNERRRGPFLAGGVFGGVALLLEYLSQGSYLFALFKEKTHRFIQTLAGFFHRIAAARNAKLGTETYKSPVLPKNQTGKSDPFESHNNGNIAHPLISVKPTQISFRRAEARLPDGPVRGEESIERAVEALGFPKGWPEDYRLPRVALLKAGKKVQGTNRALNEKGEIISIGSREVVRLIGWGLASTVYLVNNPETGELIVEKYFGRMERKQGGFGKMLVDLLYSLMRGAPFPFRHNVYSVLAIHFLNSLVNDFSFLRNSKDLTPRILYTRFDEATGSYVQAFHYVKGRKILLEEQSKASLRLKEIRSFLADKLGLWGLGRQADPLNINSPSNLIVTEERREVVLIDLIPGMLGGIFWLLPFEISYFLTGLFRNRTPFSFADSIDFQKLEGFVDALKRDNRIEGDQAEELKERVEILKASIALWRKSEGEHQVAYRKWIFHVAIPQAALDFLKWIPRALDWAFFALKTFFTRTVPHFIRLTFDRSYREASARLWIEGKLQWAEADGILSFSRGEKIRGELSRGLGRVFALLSLYPLFGVAKILKPPVFGTVLNIGFLSSFLLTQNPIYLLLLFGDGIIRAVITLVVTWRFPAIQAAFFSLIPTLGFVWGPAAQLQRDYPLLARFLLEEPLWRFGAALPGIDLHSGRAMFYARLSGIPLWINDLALRLFPWPRFSSKTRPPVATETPLAHPHDRSEGRSEVRAQEISISSPAVEAAGLNAYGRLRTNEFRVLLEDNSLPYWTSNGGMEFSDGGAAIRLEFLPKNFAAKQPSVTPNNIRDLLSVRWDRKAISSQQNYSLFPILDDQGEVSQIILRRITNLDTFEMAGPPIPLPAQIEKVDGARFAKGVRPVTAKRIYRVKLEDLLKALEQDLSSRAEVRSAPLRELRRTVGPKASAEPWRSRAEVRWEGAVAVLERILQNREDILRRIIPEENSIKAWTEFHKKLRNAEFVDSKGPLGVMKRFLPLLQKVKVDGFSIPTWSILEHLVRGLKRGELSFKTQTEVERVARIIFDYYLFYQLSLLSLRIWDEGDPNANLDEIQRLLDQLQGPATSGQQFVKRAELLPMFATAGFTDDEFSYLDLFNKMAKTLRPERFFNFSLAEAMRQASHLRAQVFAEYREQLSKRGDSGVGWKDPLPTGIFLYVRQVNGIDHFRLSNNLRLSLLRKFRELETAGRTLDDPEKRKIVWVLLAVLSADPEVFTQRPVWQGLDFRRGVRGDEKVDQQLEDLESEFFEEMGKVGKPLAREIRNLERKALPSYPLDRVDVFTHLALEDFVWASLLRPGFEKFSFEDLLFWDEKSESDPERVAWVAALHQKTGFGRNGKPYAPSEWERSSEKEARQHLSESLLEMTRKALEQVEADEGGLSPTERLLLKFLAAFSTETRAEVRGDEQGEVEKSKGTENKEPWRAFIPEGIQTNPPWKSHRDYAKFGRFWMGLWLPRWKMEELTQDARGAVRRLIGKIPKNGVGLVIGYGGSPHEIVAAKQAFKWKKVFAVEFVNLWGRRRVERAAKYLYKHGYSPKDFVLYHADAKDLSNQIPDESIDGVYAAKTTLKPRSGGESIANEIIRMLRPGGYAYISVQKWDYPITDLKPFFEPHGEVLILENNSLVFQKSTSKSTQRGRGNSEKRNKGVDFPSQSRSEVREVMPAKGERGEVRGGDEEKNRIKGRAETRFLSFPPLSPHLLPVSRRAEVRSAEWPSTLPSWRPVVARAEVRGGEFEAIWAVAGITGGIVAKRLAVKMAERIKRLLEWKAAIREGKELGEQLKRGRAVWELRSRRNLPRPFVTTNHSRSVTSGNPVIQGVESMYLLSASA